MLLVFYKLIFKKVTQFTQLKVVPIIDLKKVPINLLIAKRYGLLTRVAIS